MSSSSKHWALGVAAVVVLAGLAYGYNPELFAGWIGGNRQPTILDVSLANTTGNTVYVETDSVLQVTVRNRASDMAYASLSLRGPGVTSAAMPITLGVNEVKTFDVPFTVSAGDMGKATMSVLLTHKEKKADEKNVPVTFTPLAVLSLLTIAEPLTVGKATVGTVVVENTGLNDLENYELRQIGSMAVTMQSTVLPSIPPGTSATVNLPLLPAEAGTHDVEIAVFRRDTRVSSSIPDSVTVN